MKKLAAAVLAAAVLCGGTAHAQFPTPPGTSVRTIDGQVIQVPITSSQMRATLASPQAIGGPLGSPTYVVPQQPAQAGGVIDVGQAFGFLAPYINSALGALISAGLGWLWYLLQKRFKINIDEGNRDAIHTALLNAAASLIADGAVHLQGKAIQVPNAEIANAVNEVIAAAPTAVSHFGLTPEVLKQKIIDKIPQVPAGAAMLAVANKPVAAAA